MDVTVADQLTDRVAHHGEGPMWDASAGLVRWVDLLRGDVLSVDPAGGKVGRTPVGTVAACVVPRSDGGLAVATERGFTLLDPDGSAEVLSDVWSDPTVRMNDGACDPQGRFFCGSMAYDASEGRGGLYRLDADRSVHLVLDGVTVSNGLGWSTDRSTAFYVDTPTQRVDAFSYDEESGALGERRPAIDLRGVDGVPDGLTVDADGGVWVALWGGGAVHRYVDGVLDLVVEVPVRQVSSCAFGGADLDRLYITTSADGLDDPESGAGALFVAEPGVRGLLPWSYAG
jgi:sugar lactone lactonase YvrE